VKLKAGKTELLIFICAVKLIAIMMFNVVL
jgi:hypothetical protein